jgi:hypothetical protein
MIHFFVEIYLSSKKSLILLDKFLSDGVDMKADFDQRFVIEDLAAVEDEGRLLHRRVDLLVVQSPEKSSKFISKNNYIFRKEEKIIVGWIRL